MSVVPYEIFNSAAIERHMGAAQLAVICEILKALIQNGALNQADMVARLEALSTDLMTRQGAQHAVPIVDIFRNFVAGEQERCRLKRFQHLKIRCG